nr:VanZ family protein [Rufibacter quisquiliarum]
MVRFQHFAPALGWAVLILIGTLLPAQALPPTPHWDLLSFDSLVHAVLFGCQLLLLLFGCKRAGAVPLTSRLVLLSFLVVTGFGILVEFMQGAMGWGRAFDPADMVSNSIGCVLGLAVWFLGLRRF